MDYSYIDREEFRSYYYSHSDSEVCEKFNLKKRWIPKILSFLSIEKKTREQVNEIIRKKVVSNYESFGDEIEEKRKKTCIEKYGVENPMELDSIAERVKNTINSQYDEQKKEKIEKYRRTMSEKSSDEIELHRKRLSESTKNHFANMTKEERSNFSKTMSEAYSRMSEEDKIKRAEKIIKSYEKSCIEKYGVKSTMMLDSVRDKIEDTVMEKYGVPYFCMHEKCRNGMNGISSNSKPNILFSQYLDSIGLEYEREFVIDKYSYDFRIGNVLIEINPTITHNIDISPYNNPIKKDYHYSKSVIAENNGYRCIHIWDWDDIEKVIKTTLPRDTIYARKCEVGEVDKDTAIHFINENHI